MFMVIAFAGVYSCRIAREIPAEAIRPLDAERILKRIERNSLDYEYLTINRINCHFSNSQMSTSFRVNLKAERDKSVLMSISKLNIPVGRVLLTPDSVTYVNFIDRNFFVDDYTFLREFLNIYIDFQTIQAILSNNADLFFNYPGMQGPENFESTIEDGLYVLSSQKEAWNFNKSKNIMVEDGQNYYKKLFVDPHSFALIKFITGSNYDNGNLEIGFADFMNLERKDYPGSVDIKMVSDFESTEIKIRMNGLSTDRIDDINLKIPGTYEQLKVD